MALSVLLLLCFVVASVAKEEAHVVTISNVQPRRDTQGTILDAHDGKVLFKDGVYYWYAASYGTCQEPAGSSGCSGAAFGSCGFRYCFSSLYLSLF